MPTSSRVTNANLADYFVPAWLWLILVAWAAVSWGEMYVPADDPTVIERAELIVVGRMIVESLVKVPHVSGSGSRSWEHHVTLVISEVLRGDAAPGDQIPIVVDYGVMPRRPKTIRVDANGTQTVLREGDELNILAGGHSVEPRIEDARENALYFLRTQPPNLYHPMGVGRLRLVNGEDVQRVEWKEYYLALMGSTPDDALRAFGEKYPELAERSSERLDFLEIERLSALEDPYERFERALPFYLNMEPEGWRLRPRAKMILISCGAVAGHGLKPYFQDERYSILRPDIISIWRETKFSGSVPLLLQLLEEHELFWADQNLTEDWWSRDRGSQESRYRHRVYSEDYQAIWTLSELGDPVARVGLESFRDRWIAMGYEQSQLVEMCEHALYDL